MSFFSGIFLWGLVAAAGPVIIHLLNRRRFRTIDWAAIAFLEDAIKKNKRILDIRDLILLILRTLAVLLFILALAQPYWSRAAAGGHQPVHAVLVIDNSLSMGYSELKDTLLDVARKQAADVINDLPRGSEISLVPMCAASGGASGGGGEGPTREVYLTAADAVEALKQIRLVDRSAHAADAAQAARRACNLPGRLPAKRIVFFSDMQDLTWSAPDLAQSFRGLDAVQIVQIGPTQRGNTSVASFQLRDRVADAQNPALFDAVIRHDSPTPRRGARVWLKIDEQTVEERRIDLIPGQNLELTFSYRFPVAGTSRDPLYARARVEIEHDTLAADDFRALVVPVLSGVPVLFVDQYGPNEDVNHGRYGETYPVRRLLAPAVRARQTTPLIQVRHRTADQITLEELKDVRLVVIAGVRSLSPEADQLLREYLEQGGQVLLAAGGDFDPALWNAVSWRQGAGILPAPLKPQLLGKLPGPNEPAPKVFHLDPRSFADAKLRSVYTQPFFYRAAAVDLAGAAAVDAAERRAWEVRRAQREAAHQKEQQWAELERAGKLTPEQVQQRDQERQALADQTPHWLTWSNLLAADPAGLSADAVVARSRPIILGLYSNGEVFMLRRQIGKGTVQMMTTGLFPVWNDMAVNYSVLLLEQAVRGLLAQGLPNLNVDQDSSVTIPVEPRDQAAAFTLQEPTQTEPRDLAIEAVGERTFGLPLHALTQRGFYVVRRLPTTDPQTGQPGKDGWALTLAQNGPAEESNLAAVDHKLVEKNLAPVKVAWAGAKESTGLQGPVLARQDLWRWLMALALTCLLVEMLFLSRLESLWLKRGRGPVGAA